MILKRVSASKGSMELGATFLAKMGENRGRRRKKQYIVSVEWFFGTVVSRRGLVCLGWGVLGEERA